MEAFNSCSVPVLGRFKQLGAGLAGGSFSISLSFLLLSLSLSLPVSTLHVVSGQGNQTCHVVTKVSKQVSWERAGGNCIAFQNLTITLFCALPMETSPGTGLKQGNIDSILRWVIDKVLGCSCTGCGSFCANNSVPYRRMWHAYTQACKINRIPDWQCSELPQG